MKKIISLTMFIFVACCLTGCGKEIEYYCNAGDVLTGDKCYSKTISEPMLRCPSSYTLINGVCRWNAAVGYTTEPTYYCKVGKLVNSVCVVEKTYDAFKK